MQRAEALTLEQIEQFLAASQAVQLKALDREQTYQWMEATLRVQRYREQAKAVRGLLLRYLAKMTGLSTAQVDRLVRRYRQSGQLQVTSYRRHRFSHRYTRADVELLARVDEAHDTLSGPATQKILQREWRIYRRPPFQRLASISVAHIYNLRKQRHYRQCRQNFTHTRPVQTPIGERRRPDPQGQPGHLRVDTVHQGDQDGVKGVYHINTVDEVTQWQVVLCVPQISEGWLQPVLDSLLEQFPFHIHSFHSDNGSEFINYTVARLLEKLLIEQTKSRPRHSNDNGLVESKNGWVIRKHMGYSHIAQLHAQRIQRFFEQHFNPYLNLHRPCAQADLEVDAQGRRRRIYRRYQTPLETLLLLNKPQQYLRPDITLKILRTQAAQLSDTQAAHQMQLAKQKLFAEMRRGAPERPWK